MIKKDMAKSYSYHLHALYPVSASILPSEITCVPPNGKQCCTFISGVVNVTIHAT